MHFVDLVWKHLHLLQDKVQGYYLEFGSSLQFKKVLFFKNIDDVKTPESFPSLRFIVKSLEEMVIKLVGAHQDKDPKSTKLRQFQFAILKFQTAVYEHQIHLFFGCVKDDHLKPMINLLQGERPSQFITRADFFDRAQPLIFGKAIKIFCVVLDLGLNLTSSSNLHESKLVDNILNDKFCSRFKTCPSTDCCMQLAHRLVNNLSNAPHGTYNIMISVLNDLENGIKKKSSSRLESSSSFNGGVKIQARKAKVLSNTELLSSIRMNTPVLSRNDSTTDSSLSTTNSLSNAAASTASSERYEQITNKALHSSMHGSRNKENMVNTLRLVEPNKRGASTLDDDDYDNDDDNLRDISFSPSKKPRLIIVVDNPATYLSHLFLLFVYLFIYLFKGIMSLSRIDLY